MEAIFTEQCRPIRKDAEKMIMNCDILYVQEHWLCTEQIDQLRDVSADFHVTGVSGFDNKEVLRGCPYGGTAILWRKDLHVFIDNIETHSKRVCGLHMYDNMNTNLLLLNVYMPCDTTDVERDEFSFVLSVISSVIDIYPDAMVILGGDFNVDFARHTTNCQALMSFCLEHNIEPVVKHEKCSVDFTYNFCMQRFSTIDHFFVSKYMFESCVDSVNVCHDVDNYSDHAPLILHLKNMNWSDYVHVSEKNWYL